MVREEAFGQFAIELNPMYFSRYFSIVARSILFSVILTFAFGCRYTTGQLVEVTPYVTARDSTISTLQPIVMPVDSFDSAYRDVAVRAVISFYQRRHERLFWISGPRRSVAAESLINFIENVRYFGLLPGDYHLTEIRGLEGGLNSAKNICRLEALLTDAYLQMSRHIRVGRTIKSTAEQDSLSLSSLEGYVQGGALRDKITLGEPSFFGYQSLKRGLGQLIDSLPADQRKAVLSSSPFVADDLRERLRMIEINLERWRLEKAAFGSRYIFVNIPAFKLYVVENDSVILESRVIVGTLKTPTPLLSSVVECFVTYPYWHVPRKIAVEEYLPMIQRDSTFIERNNFDVLNRKGSLINPDSVDWNRFNKNNFPVSLRQRDGRDNALGIIKFLFDNPYAVFLHDTNAKRLFMSKARAFSHGCIRMEKAVELAHYLVTGDLNKRSREVERYLKEESRHWIELQNPIPIFVRYYTCDSYDVDLKYYKDLYGKDRRMRDILYTDITGH